MSTASQISRFLSRFDPALARQARALRKALRALVPGAHELVYDNFNALVFAYSPTERPSEARLSLAVYGSRGTKQRSGGWVNLFFADGARLDDPQGLLQGSGAKMRHVRVEELEQPALRALLAQVLPAFPPGKGPTVVRASSTNPRRSPLTARRRG